MYYNSADFEFTSALEATWQVVRQEIEQINSRDFVEWPERHLYGKGWDIFGLYAFGLKLAKNCELCPESTKLIESIPGLVTAGFSALKPGTHIAPHTGYPDGVLRCHLGLIGCDGCALRVGDETRNWQEGKCLVFDDTTEHEAWNRGNQTRIVLLLDFKNPALVSDRSNGSITKPQGLWQQLKQKLFAADM